MPGSASPEDFGAPDRTAMVERASAALTSRDWALDYWEGEINGFETPRYLRPATVVGKADGKLVDGSWGGACVFHGLTGCQIFETRPAGCRGVEPSPDSKRCHARHSSKAALAAAWGPFQDVLDEALSRARTGARP